MAGLEASIATLISRLETVTARLEAVESQLGGAPASSSSSSSSSSGAAGGVEPAPWFARFDAAANALLPTLAGAIDKIGTPELKAQGAAFAQLIEAKRAFLFTVATSKKPDDATFNSLLADMSAKISEVISIRDKARGNAAWNHLSALSELVPGFGWVQVSPTPGPHWKDFCGNSQFYSNKLIREYKGKDDNQMAFVNALHTFETEIQGLIKDSHTTGLVWNARGGDAGAAKAAAPAPVAPPAGGPPPPAPPPAGLLTSPAPAKGGADPSALFAELNKGGAVTAGLRKVTKDMKTKGQTKSSVVPAAETKAPAARPKFGSAVKKGTPKFELQGNKWVVEWQENNKEIVIADTQVKQTVYVYNCTNSVVQIKGKVNAVTLDGCKKVGLCFDNVVASVELVNCTSCEVQSIGFVPSFAIDKCSSIQVILSDACLASEIVTAKSDQLNVILPPLNPNDDITEIAIPEQFKTTVVNRQLKTVHVEHV